MTIAAMLIGTLLGSAPAPALDARSFRAPIVLADRELIDSQGTRLRLKDDVVDAGPTLISFTWTGCSEVCPVSDLIMNMVEDSLDDARHADVRLVTLTLDPGNDNPQRLAQHARKVGAGPRRQWLSGDVLAVGDVLAGLGMQFGRIEEHELFFVVIDRSGRRSSRIGAKHASPEVLLRRLEALR